MHLVCKITKELTLTSDMTGNARARDFLKNTYIFTRFRIDLLMSSQRRVDERESTQCAWNFVAFFCAYVANDKEDSAKLFGSRSLRQKMAQNPTRSVYKKSIRMAVSTAALA